MQLVITLSNDKIKEIQSSILLCLYMLLCFYFHFVTREMKPIITILIILSSFLSLFYSRVDKVKIHYNFNTASLWVGFIFLCLMIQIINSTIHPTFLYFLSAPAFAYFILENKFHRRIIHIPILVISSFFIYYIVSGQDLDQIFPHSSRNYISVIMITNTALINFIEWKQFRRISVWPSFLTFVFSLFAIGRAGIICSSILFFSTLFCLFDKLTATKKIIYSLIIIIPSVILIIVFLDSIINVLKGSIFFEHFLEAGMKDVARNVLFQNYINNINFKTLLLGYNFQSDPLFIKYALNPHNSYIRLHYNVGILFFPILFYLLYTLFKLFFQIKLYFIILMVLLLRGWTDSVFFIREYDFLIILFILITNKYINYDK